MHRIERAVSDWRRVYMRLCAAEDWLRHRTGTPPADLMAAGEDLAAEVSRLQDEEERALRAIDAALLAAKRRAVGSAESGCSSSKPQ